MKMRLIFLVAALSLAGCGAAYISPKVVATDDKVRILPLTAESVLMANRSSYSPKQLPSVFFQTAGGAQGMRGAGATPTPSIDMQKRPTSMTLTVPLAAETGPYKIGVGDVLLLATKSGGNTVEELSGLLAAQNRRQGYTVQDDGAIAIPDIGRIQVADLTIEDAEATVFQTLIENQVDPSFSLEVAEFNSKKVSIGGAVGAPTVAPINLTPLTLDQALSAARGINTKDIDFASIRIYRDGNLYQIPVTDYLTNARLQKTRLVAGDSVFVDTEFELDKAQAYFAEQITLSQFRQNARVQALNELESEVNLRRAALNEARANYQARLELDGVDRDYVYLTGEVTKPGRFKLPYGRAATLADALYSEGGFSAETGNPAQIYVLRGSDNPADFGAVTAWHLNAANVANMLLATRMEMRPNDIVFIAEQPITRWNRVVQQIVPSLITTAGAAAAN